MMLKIQLCITGINYILKYVINVQSEFRKCCFLNLNKIKTKRISNHMSQYFNILFTIEHREHNKCLNRNLIFYLLYELISILMHATGLKKVGTGATKG